MHKSEEHEFYVSLCSFTFVLSILDLQRHFTNNAIANISPKANNGQWKWDLKSGFAMCRPAMQREITTRRPAKRKPNQSDRVTLMALPEHEQHSVITAKINRVTETRIGARTGLAQVTGIRKSTSQSIIELGQLTRILSQI